MNTGTGIIIWQRRIGVLAMILLTLALLSLADALIGGFKGTGGTIELLPGEHFQISGPLPPKTETLAQFVIEGQPDDKTVQLIPETIFSGYWFGGPMWRGAIHVSPAGLESTHIIQVKDRFGEKQNPALVFSVRIWPDLATKNAHSPSFITRKTGHNPFFYASLFAVGGALAGLLNFLLGVLWSRHLAANHCGEIFRVKKLEEETEVTCDLMHAPALQPGMLCTIFRPLGEKICSAQIIRLEKNEISLLVPRAERVSLGDVACFILPADGNQETAEPSR